MTVTHDSPGLAGSGKESQPPRCRLIRGWWITPASRIAQLGPQQPGTVALTVERSQHRLIEQVELPRAIRRIDSQRRDLAGTDDLGGTVVEPLMIDNDVATFGGSESDLSEQLTDVFQMAPVRPVVDDRLIAPERSGSGSHLTSASGPIGRTLEDTCPTGTPVAAVIVTPTTSMNIARCSFDTFRSPQMCTLPARSPMPVMALCHAHRSALAGGRTACVQPCPDAGCSRRSSKTTSVSSGRRGRRFGSAAA